MSTTTLRPVFARNLRHALAMRPITQENFAREMNVSIRTVSGWCRGQTLKPSRTYLRRLAEALEVEPEWLFTEHGFGNDG